MYVKFGSGAGIILVAAVLFCLPVDPPLPHLLGKPELNLNGLVIVPDQIDGYREAVHLTWADYNSDSLRVYSYTLLRKLSDDSSYDVFAGSRGIPSDTTEFLDILEDYTFPDNGFDSILYRMFAIDTAGRAGDTSDPCLLLVAPQADFQQFDDSTGCLKWESWIRGGVTSRCSVWCEEKDLYWNSERMEEFPFTDEPARFTACFPDTLMPPVAGRWWYALYIRANMVQSLVIGPIDVP